MTSPHPDQPAPADRRTLPYPGDEAITAARDRAHQAFAQLFTALGAGRHRLHHAAVDVEGRHALASATVDVTTAPAWHLNADPHEFTVIEAAVTAALEGSCTVLATLVVQTEQAPGPIVCGVADQVRMAARHEDRRGAGRRRAVRGQLSARAVPAGPIRHRLRPPPGPGGAGTPRQLPIPYAL